MDRSTFEHDLNRYAQLIVEVGLNLQAGQRLCINGRSMPQGVSLAAAPLVRAVARYAYEAQASLVDVLWADEALSTIRHRHAPRDSFEIYPTWRADGLLQAMERRDASLTILADDPYLLDDEDEESVAVEQQATLRENRAWRDLFRRNVTNWCVVGAATPAWAARAFADARSEDQVHLLWQALFRSCRVDTVDPLRAWRNHLNDLVARCDFLNQRGYESLHFRAEGTDLLLRLPRQHVWASARFQSANKVTFTANIPSEEIFTLPHRLHAEGTVSASRPMNYGGTMIEGLVLRFEQGQVVHATARSGESSLRRLLDIDDGARRLGEVALVPNSSPISKMDILFHNTLLDENAATHIALGSAYRVSIEDGPSMNSEAFLAAGGNESLLHADFMIGTADMDVDGVLPDGQREAVMRRGEWAF